MTSEVMEKQLWIVPALEAANPSLARDLFSCFVVTGSGHADLFSSATVNYNRRSSIALSVGSRRMSCIGRISGL